MDYYDDFGYDPCDEDWSGQFFEPDDFETYNQNEADDYRHEGDDLADEPCTLCPLAASCDPQEPCADCPYPGAGLGTEPDEDEPYDRWNDEGRPPGWDKWEG